MDYKLKKSLGQHFLKDDSISKRIVDEIKQHNFNCLLEIGPGGGALTKSLLKIPDIDFKAVELDEEKITFLEKTYPAIKDKLIHQSFLDMQLPFVPSSPLEGGGASPLKGNEFMVVGNFPYNISSQILFKVLEWKQLVPLVIGMFQKEVAERVASKEGSKVYGVTSVLVQAFYNVDYLFDVAPEAFNPPPKVMSGIIRLTRRDDVPAMKSERALFVLVKTAFNQRRKTLRNAVKSLFSAEVLKDVLFDKRAEALSVNDFASLTFRMN